MTPAPTTPQQVKVLVSPEAWEGLIALARASYYVSTRSTTGRGVGQYMHALFAINHARIYPPTATPSHIAFNGGGFIDNRPAFLREGQHPDYMPPWVMPDQFEYRIPRCFVRAHLPLELMHRLAISGGITLPSHRSKHNARTPRAFPFDSTTRSSSAIMEVVGRRLLTPYNVPHNPSPVNNRMRNTYKDVVW